MENRSRARSVDRTSAAHRLCLSHLTGGGDFQRRRHLLLLTIDTIVRTAIHQGKERAACLTI
jgi:hypothetical protein